MSRNGRLLAPCALAILALGTSACTSTNHTVADRPDLLEQPPQPETLGEAIQRAQREGCLRAGSNRDLSCERRLDEWAEVIAPPEPPQPAEPPAPPPAPDPDRR